MASRRKNGVAEGKAVPPTETASTPKRLRSGPPTPPAAGQELPELRSLLQRAQEEQEPLRQQLAEVFRLVQEASRESQELRQELKRTTDLLAEHRARKGPGPETEVAAEGAGGRKPLGFTVDSKAVVVEVHPDTPAAQAGLQLGDVIVSVNAQAIHEGTELSQVVAQAAPGQEITIEVARGEATAELKARLPEESSAAEGATSS